jgi:hypothetical protein
LKGKPPDFSCKPSYICKFIERSDRRVCGYAAGILAKPRLLANSEIARWTIAGMFWIIPIASVFIANTTWDGSASQALDEMPADEIHRAVKISGVYGEVHETTDWIASTLPRKLGNGKNAGG